MTNVEENVPHPNSESGMAAEGAATHVFDVGAELGSRASRPKPVPHLTPAERAARGRATRGELPRSTTPTGSRDRVGETRSIFSRIRPRRAYRSLGRSAMGAC